MIITPKFRTIAFASCIVSIVLFLIVGIYRTNFLPHNNVLYDTIYTLSQLAYIVALFYLIELLKYAGESKAVVTGFYVYCAVVVITSIIGFASFSPTIMITISTAIYFAVLLSTLYA